MPQASIEDKLDGLVRQYQDKDLKAKEVRDVFVRDILNTIAQHGRGGPKTSAVMTEAASMYKPGESTVPVRPKSV